jgi:hypothetical protein
MVYYIREKFDSRGDVVMKVELEQKEIEMIVGELRTNISELRSLIASGMRKELRDDIRKDKLALMGIVAKLEAAAKNLEFLETGRAA